MSLYILAMKQDMKADFSNITLGDAAFSRRAFSND